MLVVVGGGGFSGEPPHNRTSYCLHTPMLTILVVSTTEVTSCARAMGDEYLHIIKCG